MCVCVGATGAERFFSAALGPGRGRRRVRPLHEVPAPRLRLLHRRRRVNWPHHPSLYGDFLTGTFFDRRIGPHYPGQGLPLSPAPVVLAGACAPQMRCICRFWQHFLGDNRLLPVVLLENAAEYSKCTRAFHLASTMATRCVWSFWHWILSENIALFHAKLPKNGTDCSKRIVASRLAVTKYFFHI